jgi:aldehyde dehydrogenase (NAD+)
VPAHDFSVSHELEPLLAAFGIESCLQTTGGLPVRSPISGEVIGCVPQTTAEQARAAIGRAAAAFAAWRDVPAPRRGELVRVLGEELRAAKASLGRLVTIETGKILSEGLGEVQEMIDICDFAVGLSRQLHGLTIASERPEHRLMESWHPLGPCGVITAFNFPVAVWSWNAALALVCGDPVIWKPSEKTPLCALAVDAVLRKAAKRVGFEVPAGLSAVLVGGPALGEMLIDDPRVKLVSATGSTAMGRAVAPRLAKRFARSILELGGNNGAIIAPSADVEMTLRAVAFAAVGTAGQRCTTLRRAFIHDQLYTPLVERLVAVYERIPIGNPLQAGTLLGPLIDRRAEEAMQAALAEATACGGIVHGGARWRANETGEAYYARPAIVEMREQTGPMLRETFAPILYVMRYRDLGQAIELHNAVAAGLASSIFTGDMREAELFVSASGSDCGIANVNVGPSGAEIGGAFGGEKETGGGREAGSDSWKAYMRRATCTINYGKTLPLAQGVEFSVG